MTTMNNAPDNRVIFLDNLRYFSVLCVIILHASPAYIIRTSAWWPVIDPDNTVIANILAAFFDAFAMPLLFYIAGFFAVPTMNKKGIPLFLKGKLKRLGIPWIICILTINPITLLIAHYLRHNLTLTMSYWDLWLSYVKNFTEFIFRVRNWISDPVPQYFQGYMWFISMLFVFFLIFALIYKVKRNWFTTINESCKPANASISKTLQFLFLAGFLTFFLSEILIFFLVIPATREPEAWVSFSGFIELQPSRLFLHMIYFVLGILTYKNKWIERAIFPGHLIAWAISFFILLFSFYYANNLYIQKVILSAPGNLIIIYQTAAFFIRNLLTMSILGLSVALAIRYWNRPARIDRNLASNSYNLYIAHYPTVIMLQFALLFIPGIPGVIKFGIVSVLSIIFTYLVSQFLIKPFPKLTVALLSIMLIVMFVVIKP
jgi:glucans biosynthesis protein C